MHVLILEVNLSGHHVAYLEQVAQLHLELGRAVTVAVSGRYAADPALERLGRTFGRALTIVALPAGECDRAMASPLGDAGRELALWRIFGRALRALSAERPVDYVFLPYLDYCLNAIGLLGSPFGKVSWGGICMRPAFHYHDSGVIAPRSRTHPLKRQLFRRLLRIRTLSALYSIDELLVGYVGARYPKLSGRLRYLPDPAAEPQPCDLHPLRARYRIPPGAKIVLVYGAIDERKGAFQLLDALQQHAELAKWHVFLVGCQSPAVGAAISGARWAALKEGGRLHSLDAYVPNEVEQQVFALCDAVWVGYAGHYTMSGVLVRAGMYGKPVVACAEGLIGWYAADKGVGITVDGTTGSVADALMRLSEEAQAKSFGVRCRNQFKFHTWQRFKSALKAP